MSAEIAGGAGIFDLYSFIIAKANLFCSSGTLGGAGTNNEFLLIISGFRAGIFLAFSGALGAFSLVNTGLELFGGAGIFKEAFGGSGILDLYNFKIAKASLFCSSGTFGGNGTKIEFRLMMSLSSAGIF